MVFNLCVPAYPLDGGRILVDTLLIAGVSTVTTAHITIALATICGIGMIVLGILRIFGLMLILIGIFVLSNTFQLYQAFEKGQLEYHPLFQRGSAETRQAEAYGGGGRRVEMQGP